MYSIRDDFLDEFDVALTELVGIGSEPLVIFTATWPILREIGSKDAAVLDRILDLLIRLAKGRDILMPSFTSGYINGVCDLDSSPGTTGVLSERFRSIPGVKRTLSAFFSYLILGPSASRVSQLMPEHAWGDGSLYEWMESTNARFLMLGTHPTHCSYLHRLEWIVRDSLPYRYCKKFSGNLIRDGVAISCSETLFVRSLNPEAIQDFTKLMPMLDVGCMEKRSVRGVSLATYNAVPLRNTVLPLILEKPLLVLKNDYDFIDKII